MVINKKIIFVLIAFLLVILLPFWLISRSNQQTSPTGNDINQPENSGSKIDVPAIEKFPNAIEEMKKEEKVTITNDSKSVTVNNPARNADEIISPNDVMMKKDPRYEIVYFNYPEKKSFLISILDKNLEESRKAAEQNLLDKLGIEKEKACELSVSLYVDKDINSSAAGKDYGLSFCPSGKLLPK